MRRLLLGTFAATVVATTACGGDSSTGPSITTAGSYSLQSVNSQQLPYVILDDANGKFEILADTYAISGNGTYTGQTLVRSTINAEVQTDTLSSNGTYTRSGNSISLTDASDPTNTVTGTLSATGLTISVEGFVLVYQRSGS